MRESSDTTSGFTGFGTQWFDYDNDGWLDLFIANGGVTIVGTEHSGKSPYAQRKQLFHNEGRGKRFRDVSREGGRAFQIEEVSRAAAFGDIDNDGAIDIVVTNNNGPARLLRNQTGARRHWLITPIRHFHVAHPRRRRMLSDVQYTCIGGHESSIRIRREISPSVESWIVLMSSCGIFIQ